MPKREDAAVAALQKQEKFNSSPEVFDFENIHSGACDSEGGSVTRSQFNYVTTTAAANDYVNFDLSLKKQSSNNNFHLSKSIILNKFFRSTEKNFAAYENLCTGCGYGVFEARGRLCNFCQFVVSGGFLGADAESVAKEEVGNIYENICEKCSAIYSGEECSLCSATTPTTTPTTTTYDEFDDNIIVNTSSKTSITKTNNSNSNNKKRLFYGLIGSLKRSKTISNNNITGSNASSNERLKSSPPSPKSTSVSPRNRLEIVHNVDGYENVFRTNETFDLNRICELKRLKAATTSRHIYGRLRNDQLVADKARNESSSCNSIVAAAATTVTSSSFHQSDDHLTSAVGYVNLHTSEDGGVVVGKNSQSDPNLLKINSSSTLWKRSTIGRFKLTRSKTKEKINKGQVLSPLTQQKQGLYLPDSVCQWMTTLRSETHRYRCFGIPDDVTVCDPKSIPPKNSYHQLQWSSSIDDLATSVLVSSTVANYINDCNTNSPKKNSGITLLSLKNHDINVEKNKNYEDCDAVTFRCDEFSCSPLATVESKQTPVDYFARQMVNEFKRSLMEKQKQQQQEEEEMYCCLRNHATELRSKRQAIYLKLDEAPSVISSFVSCTTRDPLSNAQNDLTTAGCDSRFVTIEETTSGASPENERRHAISEKNSEFLVDILSAFDSFLRRDSSTDAVSRFDTDNIECSAATATVAQPHCHIASDRHLNPEQLGSDENKILKRSTTITTKTIKTSPLCYDIEQLFYGLVLSRSLNRIFLSYDAYLKVFIRRVVDNRAGYSEWEYVRLLKKFKRFVEFCQSGNRSEKARKGLIISDCGSDLMQVIPNEILPLHSPNSNEKSIPLVSKTFDKQPKSLSSLIVFPLSMTVPSTIETETSAKIATATTAIADSNMTASLSTAIINKNNNNCKNKSKDDENIYQPIWKFKTVGEVQERYQTDADYFDIVPTTSDNAATKQSIEGRESSFDVEDHGEWETDDEFMFTRKLDRERGGVDGGNCDNGLSADYGSGLDAGRRGIDSLSLKSNNSSNVKSSISHSGSTITGYASNSSSTITIASTASLMHPIFRNICIFYSLTDPKMRAIFYDYDRIQCWLRFPSRMSSLVSLCGVGSDDKKTKEMPNCVKTGTPLISTSPVPIRPRCNSPEKKGESGSTFAQKYSLADSVQAWKFMLLDVNYLEDEEDMIVSESEILRAQEIKEEEPKPQVNILQRFKSISSGNLLEIPAEEDKKSITERMRNKLQRGVFKLNVRSPKGEKKSRGIFRRTEATSLYLEDGVKPKYRIFGASLDQLELNQTTHPNVPRFVVDCIEYIERRDCIQMDGLYRASGNKVSIDELKQKLSESYIYDPKLLVTDDIHTLTSLLKMFFRELAAPLIPQETYQKVGRNLMDKSTIEGLKNLFKEMRNPNRSTLKFLIKHLTTVAHYSSENRMPASNLAIVWGPCILSANQIEYDIARMNTLAKVLIENYDRIFGDNERLVS